MNKFFEQNIWASGLFLGILIAMSIYFYYKKVKEQVNKYPQSNIFGKFGSNKLTIILSILAVFVIFPLVSYFVLMPMFSVNAEDELARLQTDNTQNVATQFMDKVSAFFTFVYSHPKWRNLLQIIVSSIILISLIFKKDKWLLTGNESSANWTWGDIADIFGRKYVRIILIIPFSALLILGLIGFFNNL